LHLLASALLLAVSLHAGAQTTCATQVPGQTGTKTQSGLFCVVAITTGSEASELDYGATYAAYNGSAGTGAGYGSFGGAALDATGNVYFFAGGDAGGNGFDIYKATSSAAQTVIYTSPEFASQTDTSPLVQAPSFLGVDASGDLSFYGQGVTQSGIYGIKAGPAQPQPPQPQPLVTLSTSVNGNGYPKSDSVLNNSGQLAVWIPIPEFNPSPTLECRPFQLGIAQFGAATVNLPVPLTCGGFLPPAINDKGEVVYAFNTPVNIDGVTQPGLQAALGFYTPLTVSGNNYSVAYSWVQALTEYSSSLPGLAGYSTSDVSLNDNELAAAILSNQGKFPELVIVDFGPTTYPNPSVTTLIKGGAVSSAPYGGVLCGTPAMNTAGQVLFISGSSGSSGICGSTLYLANANGTPPKQIITAGDQFTDASTGTTWTIVYVAGTTQQSLNDNCQVAAYVLAASSPSNIEQPFIVRADALPGVCSVQPIVPSVVGYTQAAATSALTLAGFELGAVTTQASTSIPPGLVISQSPVAGTPAAAGSVVSLVVSSGVSVRNVVGLPLATASVSLTSAGLTTGSISQQYSTAPQGSVLSESPTAGSPVAGGTAVSLVISEGAPPVQVPELVGDTQTAAAAALNSVGLVLGSALQQASTSVPQGEVSNQSPPAGNSVAVGSAVNVIVSSGPPQISIVLSGAPQFTYVTGDCSPFCSNYLNVTVTLSNNGNVTANAIDLGSFSLNGYSATTSTIVAQNLASGAPAAVYLTVPALAVTSGAGVLKLSGTYIAGTLTGNWSVSARISVPAL
jgi:beta-lactam-binding protein with PASTA domain